MATSEYMNYTQIAMQSNPFYHDYCGYCNCRIDDLEEGTYTGNWNFESKKWFDEDDCNCTFCIKCIISLGKQKKWNDRFQMFELECPRCKGNISFLSEIYEECPICEDPCDYDNNHNDITFTKNYDDNGFLDTDSECNCYFHIDCMKRLVKSKATYDNGNRTYNLDCPRCKNDIGCFARKYRIRKVVRSVNRK